MDLKAFFKMIGIFCQACIYALTTLGVLHLLISNGLVGWAACIFVLAFSLYATYRLKKGV